MHAERRILSNTAVLTLGQAVAQLSNFLFAIIFARSFGTELFGWYSLAMAVGSVASIFVSFGTHQMLVRNLAARPERTREQLETALPLHVIFGAIISAVLLLGAATVLGDDDLPLLFVFVAGHHVLLRITLLLLIPFTARQRMLVPAMVDAGERVLSLVVAMLLLQVGLGAQWIVAALPLASLVALVVAYRAVQSLLGPRRGQRPPLRKSLALYVAAWPFLGILLLNVLYMRAAVLLLSGLADAADVGIYSAADRIMMLVGIVNAMFIAAVLPAISALVEDQRDAAVKTAQRCMRLLIVFSVPTSGLLAIFSGDVVRTMFGAEFSAAAPILAVLAAATVLKGIGALRVAVAIGVGLQHDVARSRLITLIAFLALGALLIMLVGPLGLAVAALAAEGAYAFLVERALRARDFACPAAPVAWKPALAVSIGAGGALLLQDWHWLLALPITSALIAAAVVLLGAIRRYDIAYLWQVLGLRSAQ